jgi:Pyruvate/2-oxoacid:ferredoxin oxidoreductase delta subunit
MEPGVELAIVPYLYDLDAAHTGRLFLESVAGDMVVLGWMFPRAAFWVLDRDGIKGHFGESQLKPPDADDDEDEGEGADGEPEPPKGIGALGVPDRMIYCLDLRDFNNQQPYVDEVRRIVQECRERREAKERERAAASSPALVPLGLELVTKNGKTPPPNVAPEQLLAAPGRRWYPVIDYSRCTNCMECIDFCLFGVYGVDSQDRINVENQDNCKRGCPACSRVCPEQAIIFPDYKTPAIAGAPVGAISGLKIDLTKLFGGDAKDALQQAVLERDTELVKDGREAVGMAVGVPKRQADKPQGPKDDLDKLMDSLDALDI